MADQGTISRIGGILKTTFGPRVEEQQNKTATVRKRYGKADSYFRAPGDRFEFPARVAGARGAWAPSASDDPLPTPQEQNEQKFAVYDRGYTAQISFYDKDIENASKNFQTFIPLMEDRMTNIIQDGEKIINIDICAGDGSGILGLVNANVAAANTVALQIGTAFGQYGSRYLQDAGDVIDFYDPTLTTSRTGGAGVQVVSVARSVAGAPPTATLSAAVTLTAGDVMVRGGGRVNKSYIGFYSATDDAATTFQGLSRATYPILRGNHINAGGNSLNTGYLENLMDAIDSAAGAPLDEFLMGQAQFAAYLNLGYSLKRFMDTKFDAGFRTAEFAGKPILEDVDVPSQFVYGITKDAVKFGEVSPMNFMDRDGDVLKWYPGYARYAAVPREYGNMLYTRPNALGRIDDLAYTQSVPYAK